MTDPYSGMEVTLMSSQAALLIIHIRDDLFFLGEESWRYSAWNGDTVCSGTSTSSLYSYIARSEVSSYSFFVRYLVSKPALSKWENLLSP
jgi:hypothetical protein